jgi:peptidoglycan/LPS O-acetylase OafA/YrhL
MAVPTKSQASVGAKEYSNLDVLRATAVTLVLIAHLCIFFGLADRGGFNPRGLGVLGVLFFFVHTSLVLMFSLQRQERKFGRSGLFRAFILRRIFRIYPLSLTVLAIICLFHLPSSYLNVHSLKYLPPDALQLISNALLAQNLVNKLSILGVMWSLPYEMQMYVFLPFLYLFAGRIRSVWPLVALWVAAALASFAQPHIHRMPDFFIYVPCFVPGIIAYRVSMRSKPFVPFLWMPLLLGALAVIYMYGYQTEADAHIGAWRGMFICLAIGLTLPHYVEVASPLVRRVSHLIAKYSYGIYLVHYFCIWTAFHTLRFLPGAAQWLVFAVLMAALPVLLFHAVEAPMIAVGNRVATRLFVRPPAHAAAEAAPVQ